MARGRMITNQICRDKRVNQLSDDTSRLAFTWLVTFADCEGRTYGDPALVRSMIFPRRDDVTTAQMEAYITEWDALGLACWYTAGDDKYIWFPGFEKNQIGMRKDKEPASEIPAPPDRIRQNDGSLPDDVRNLSGKSRVEVEVEVKENRKRRESESEVEVRGDAFSPDPLAAEFETITGRPVGNPKSAVEALKTMHAAGVEAEDVRAALAELSAKDYHPAALPGVVKSAIIARQKRTKASAPPPNAGAPVVINIDPRQVYQ